MAKTREIPCLHYISIGCCKKGRDAKHFGYCQKCNLYIPRVRQKIVNKKKKKIEKIRREEY